MKFEIRRENNTEINGVCENFPINSTPRELVVSVRNVTKSYEGNQKILDNISLNVEQGTIYGLLGPSGCGKTNLLSCILGLRSWDSGSITVLGKRVNGLQATRNIGYMPQDISLYEDISIKETIQYFGRLYALSKDEIEKQWRWITTFLQLPSSFKLVKDCSGGMKRRVSLAISLFHNPTLILLDEPTVGLDPLLRERIWSYLYDLVRTGTTIVITTHYIEEAKNSNMIGVMRNGKLLVEECPQSLLECFECELLEECVLKLCRGDFSSSQLLPSNDLQTTNIYHYPRNGCDTKDDVDYGSNTFDRLRASCTIIWLQLLRHPLFILIIILLPASQIAFCLLVVGTTPKNIEYGVINHDTPNYDTCFTAPTQRNNSICNLNFISCLVVNHFSKSKTLKLTAFESEDLARSKVDLGELWGYFVFPSNYSAHFSDLILTKQFADNETLEGSRIHLTMDLSHYLVHVIVSHDIFHGYLEFAKELAQSCGLDARALQLPLQFRKPVYGSNEFGHTEYITPIVLLFIINEISALLTSLLYVVDLTRGTLDRTRVAGLTFSEVMISQLLTQVVLVVVQALIFSAMVHVLWGLNLKGPVWLYAAILIFCSIGGGIFGLFVGVLTENASYSLLVGVWVGVYSCTYTGMQEPLEGLPKWGQHLAVNLPITVLSDSLRCVMNRGFSITNNNVWQGILKYIGWNVVFVAISVAVFIRKQTHK